jgi:hypothetical protein
MRSTSHSHTKTHALVWTEGTMVINSLSGLWSRSMRDELEPWSAPSTVICDLSGIVGLIHRSAMS